MEFTFMKILENIYLKLYTRRYKMVLFAYT